jgi:hypothetical protein
MGRQEQDSVNPGVVERELDEARPPRPEADQPRPQQGSPADNQGMGAGRARRPARDSGSRDW